jgi:hypothetical protein
LQRQGCGTFIEYRNADFFGPADVHMHALRVLERSNPGNASAAATTRMVAHVARARAVRVMAKRPGSPLRPAHCDVASLRQQGGIAEISSMPGKLLSWHAHPQLALILPSLQFAE